MRLPRLRRRHEVPAELRTVQVVEGEHAEVVAIVSALRRAGCVVESVVRLGPDSWEITARSHD